jgi:hypothetical protein
MHLEIYFVIYVAVRCFFGFWRAPMRFGAVLAALHDYKNPLPPLRPLHAALSSLAHSHTHFVTPASIDTPATTLLAARPRPPLRRCDVPRVSPSRAPSLPSPP